MRIISSFKDYYDCMMGTDREPQPLYVREPKEIKLKGDVPFEEYRMRFGYRSEWSLCQHTIGFCGKLYVMLDMTSWTPSWDNRPHIETKCWSAEDVTNFMKSALKKDGLERFFREEKGRGKSRMSRAKRNKYGRSHDGTQRSFEEFFESFYAKSDAYPQLFTHENKTHPIFTVEPRRGEYFSKSDPRILTYDGNLRHLEFYRKLSTQQTYAELLMYMSNIAVPMKPIPEHDDETLAEIKGFDRKTSFRKPPTKRR